MTRILIVEDAEDLALGLRANLEVEGYEVVLAHTGEEGLRAAKEAPPDLVILDLMLPQLDGYEVLTRLRRARMEAPVLILSARGEEVDRVRGFRVGADDYVTKPFGVLELMLRVRAILRRGPPRSTADEQRDVRRIGKLEIDVEDRTIRRAGREVLTTPRAFDLLLALIDKKGRVASRQELLHRVWGYADSVTTRTVDAHVAELRRKLEDDPASPQLILTVWKVGYRLRV
ncbi:MAG TPA: response regulator transcription factor [Gemmatimonadaceae bacterium]|nr:response regulator transcription factor [Gemmatimonadaceae bacterium]